MADAFILSTLRATYALAWSDMAGMWLAAGWTHQASGDGVSVYNTTPGGTAGAFVGGVAGAWIRLQRPDGVFEMVIQCNATTGFRWKISPSAKFTGGSPSATRVPSATDEQIMRGAGTDASPTYTATLPTFTGGVTRLHGGARGSGTYGWWIAATTVGGNPSMLLAYDPVNGASADNDKYVYQCRTGNWTVSSMNAYTDTLGTSDGSFAFYNTALTLFKGVAHIQYYSAPSVGTLGGTAGGTVNPFDATKHELIPIRLMRDANLPVVQGEKGWSTNFRWTNSVLTNVTTTTTDLLWMVIGPLWCFWDGVTTPTN